MLVTLDPNIKTIDDLVGKKLALGHIGQIMWAIETLWILEAHGIKDKIDISHVGPSGARDALLDGLADAAITSVNFNPHTQVIAPSSQTIELLGSGKRLYWIQYTEQAIDELRATGYPGTKWIAPAGSLEGMDQDTMYNADKFGPYGKDTFPEDLAYEFTKFSIDQYKEYHPYHVLTALFDPEFFAFGLTQDIMNPGAVRAFEEYGISIPKS